jgi:hypothetical protein
MSLTIDLGVEVATFPAFDEPDEVAALVGAIDHVRFNSRLPPHQWSIADLIGLGVPPSIAANFSAPGELMQALRVVELHQAWDEIERKHGLGQ